MPKAVLKNGVICPLEPLPAEWADGRELRVESAVDDDENLDLDTWFTELRSLVAQNDPADFARVEQAIRTADEQAKAMVRKQMGLP
jgi:hypothetical protein